MASRSEKRCSRTGGTLRYRGDRRQEGVWSPFDQYFDQRSDFDQWSNQWFRYMLRSMFDHWSLITCVQVSVDVINKTFQWRFRCVYSRTRKQTEFKSTRTLAEIHLQTEGLRNATPNTTPLSGLVQPIDSSRYKRHTLSDWSIIFEWLPLSISVPSVLLESRTCSLTMNE